jgi:hypothetical protein
MAKDSNSTPCKALKVRIDKKLIKPTDYICLKEKKKNFWNDIYTFSLF